MTAKHVHSYKRLPYPYRVQAACTICGRKERLENLVYLGDAPRSVGNGDRLWRW